MSDGELWAQAGLVLMSGVISLAIAKFLAGPFRSIFTHIRDTGAIRGVGRTFRREDSPRMVDSMVAVNLGGISVFAAVFKFVSYCCFFLAGGILLSAGIKAIMFR